MSDNTSRAISWVSPKIEVRKSEILGIGTFAKEPIKKDELLIVQGGRMISSDDFDDPYFESVWYHAFQVEKEVYVCPVDLNKDTFDGIFNVNHSCDPSCGMRAQLSMVAFRDIAPGEEITFDYAMCDVELEQEGWQAMDCLCKTEICRKEITGNDWKMPELRSKYKGYFSQYVQDLIDGQQINNS